MDNQNKEIKEDLVVLGGGVAGLACANRLTELGLSPLIIEAGDYPTHKVCGEFLSPECLDVLEKWNIYPEKIKQVKFHMGHEAIDFVFPKSAGSLSHLTLDPLLLARALAGGARIYKNTKVLDLKPHAGGFILKLSNDLIIHAKSLVIAAGRVMMQAEVALPYVGFKAHFNEIQSNQTLNMHCYDGGYMGIAPIENGKCNVAGIITKKKLQAFKSLDHFVEQLNIESLRKGRLLFQNWMQVQVPNFGIKQNPLWPNAYFIGDAAETIPPATGRGLSLALLGGIKAAEYCVKNHYQQFRSDWMKQSRSPIFFGKLIHYGLMKSTLSKNFAKINRVFPFLVDSFFKLTR